MINPKCKCSMLISVLGDGCRYCQPQEYIDRLHDNFDELNAELKIESDELQELKQKINEVWYLAYPESIVETGKEKLRIFNLFQDLRDTRWNYRVLHKAYNEMDAKLNERPSVESKTVDTQTGGNSIASSSHGREGYRGRESRTEQSATSNACPSSNGDR